MKLFKEIESKLLNTCKDLKNDANNQDKKVIIFSIFKYCWICIKNRKINIKSL